MIHTLRGAIGALLLALLHSVAVAAAAPYCGTERWQSLIAEAASDFELPELWLHAVMRAESGGCDRMNGAPTVSPAGAMGLMQLMPSTWAEYRAKLRLGDDPHSPRDNIRAGSAYLRDLYDRYDWPGALAAYHAGPRRYDEHLSAGRALPQSTLDYLAHVERLTADINALSTADRTLFVERTTASPASDHLSNEPNRDSLFVALRHSERRAEATPHGSTDVQQ